MKESHEKGLATCSAPSFALSAARRSAKRKQGYRWAGYIASKTPNQDADVIGLAEGNMIVSDSASPRTVLRSRRPQTRLETSCTRTGRPRRCLRRTSAAGRREKAMAIRPACTSPRSRTAEYYL